MYKSRLGRLEERKTRKRIALAIFGSIGLLVFLGVFGFKILVAFSLFVDRIRGGSKETIETEKSILLPPEFDPIREATNSASISITGHAQPDMFVLLMVNDESQKKLTVDKEGTFHMDNVKLKQGANTISGKTTDDKNNTSGLSDILRVTYKKTKPTIEVSSPDDGATIHGDTPSVVIFGKTEEGATLTINERFVVISSDGSFSYTLSLSEGEQTYKLVATDIAGNTETMERLIKYEK